MAFHGSKEFIYQREGCAAVEFEKRHDPGSVARFSGIYRCTECGFEIVCEEGKALPRHQHNQWQGPVNGSLFFISSFISYK